MKKTIFMLVSIVVLGVGGFCVYKFFPYLFAKNVDGEIVRVERVTEVEAIIAGRGQIPSGQLYSFAVSIRDSKGEIHTASSEDRQWAVAEAKQCAEAKYLRYPPWILDKAGTFYSARLLRLYDCKK